MPDSSFFDIGLPQLPTNTDPRVEPDLRDIYNAIRNLAYQIGQLGGFDSPDQQSILYTAGVAKRRVFAIADQVMNYGALVHLLTSGGVLHASLANATNNNLPCSAINNTLGTCAVNDVIELVLPSAVVTSIGGLSPGTLYYLSTTDGLLTNGAPGVAGNIRQAIGVALDTNILFFNPDYGWTVV